jgi:hypothetical protein
MAGKKKRRQRPRPITIMPATAASQYQRKWTNRELIDLLNETALYAEDMPAELWDRLRCLIVGRMMLSMEEVHEIRHRVRCEAIEEVGWDASSAEAAKRLGYSIGPDAIERSYRQFQKSLPPEQKHRKRRPVR